MLISTYNASTIIELDVRRWVSATFTRTQSSTLPVHFILFNSSGTELHNIEIRNSSVTLAELIELYPTTTKIQVRGTANENVISWNVSIVAKNTNVR